MLQIRRFEERAAQLYGMGHIGGFCHLYIGQEAVVVGMQAAINEDDAVITSYRDHGHMLACGMDAKGVMAELTGRSGGYSRGKGGSMHMFSTEKNFFGGHGIVGAQVSIGTGLAFAQKYKGDGSITLAYFGDGASNQGQVHESFNMAALWKLPVIFVIENNHYGMGTSNKRAASGKDYIAVCGYHGWHDWYLSANHNNGDYLSDHLIPGLNQRQQIDCALGTPSQTLAITRTPLAYARKNRINESIFANGR